MVKIKHASRWEKLTAKKYDNYAASYPMYRKTSQFLVKTANIRKGMTIVDLACGTGVTTHEILKKLGSSGKIIDIDFSGEMLNIAKKRNKQKNISFIQSSAEKIDMLTKESIDLVLCNSAFWQMDMDKTLRCIKRILKKDGKFIFNLPNQYYKFPKKTRNVLFFPIMQEIATKEYGLKPKKRKFKLFDFKSVNKIIKSNSFKISFCKTSAFKQTAKDIYEFYKIPVMTDKAFPNLDYSERMKILDQAYKRVDKSKEFISKWIYFVLKKLD